MRQLRSQNEANRGLTREEAVRQGLLDREFGQQASRLTYLGYARDIGADASAEALTDSVREQEAFKNPVTGAFDLDTYRRVLLDNRYTQREFEAGVKDDLTLQYLSDGVTSAISAPSELARLQAIFDNETRYIAWMALQRDALPDPAEPAEEDLTKFYTDRQTAFTVPERRRISLLSLSAADFLHQAEMIEEDIEAYYEATKTSRLATPEARTFTQAVFQSEDDALEAFGVLAGGGTLDAEGNNTFVETRTAVAEEVGVEAFRESMFSPRAGEGAVVGPFETPNGWLVGKLTEIIPGTPKPLEEVREEVVADIASEQAEAAFYAALNTFDDLIGQGLTLEEIGTEFGAPVLSFAPVDQRGITESGQVVGALVQAPEGLAQAFDLSEGIVGDRYDTEDSAYVISVDEIIPSRVPEFDEIRDDVLAAYTATQAQDALQTAADGVVSILESGVSSLEEQAELYESVVVRPETGLSRTAFDQSLPRSVLQAAFTLDGTGDAVVAPGSRPDELLVVQLEELERPEDSELGLLAPISAGRISTALNDDLLFAFEQEVRNTLGVETDDAAFAAYRTRILDDQ